MKEERQIAIRSLQHFLYCPHRWGLMEINCAWDENFYVVRANLMHKHVHEADEIKSHGKNVYSSVNVWNDKYGIYGVLDVLERDERGLNIVEYKPKQPKDMPFRREDALQVFAQKVCVDEIFGTNCKAFIYYGDTRKRVLLPLDESKDEYTNLLCGTLEKMRYCLANFVIPGINPNQYCSGCSLFDQCMPQKKLRKSIRNEIEKAIEEDK